jgi:predicted nuclease of restriction endonuclease-like (RecB) superfamily
MVLAYWLIGREIVQEVQVGDERATYGKRVLEELSERLLKRYGKGFSVTNLRYFRLFYQTYADRLPEIRHTACDELLLSDSQQRIHHKACDVLDDLCLAVEKSSHIQGFSPALSWSHYRTLSKVENKNERLFYEIEAEKEGWSVPVLERQIHSFLFARLLKSRDKNGILKLATEGQAVKNSTDTIKDPYILDFLGLPDSRQIHESKLESAIIDNLQSFLLELGKGFAFVARQKRLQYEDKFFYVDLVFYNCILKCYLLIDLKIGKLAHQDVGQMDSYVRMFDHLFIAKDDNPTIGLILCSEKNEAIARYSVLNDSKQLFASK